MDDPHTTLDVILAILLFGSLFLFAIVQVTPEHIVLACINFIDKVIDRVRGFSKTWYQRLILIPVLPLTYVLTFFAIIAVIPLALLADILWRTLGGLVCWVIFGDSYVLKPLFSER